jgi:hypothetical protein
MKLPYADRAIIAADKVTGDFLNGSHKRGGSKALDKPPTAGGPITWLRT